MIRLILDCDPGVDDAVALLLAFGARAELDLLGITTVAGNVGAAYTARNACLIRELAGAESIPVFAGCQQPLQRAPVEAGHFHGESGLGDLPIHLPQKGSESRHAVDFLLDTLRIAPARSISIVMTGPMTNVATALQREPTILTAIKEFVLMGGARSEGGNITPSAEYNIFADPHAAQVIFTADRPVYAFGLDVTHQVRASAARVAAIRAIGSRAARIAAQLLDFSNHLPPNGPPERGAPLHDPCPLVWLLAPHLFRFERCSIDVECDSPLTQGHTAVEFRERSDRAQNVHWGVWADADGVFARLEQSLGALP